MTADQRDEALEHREAMTTGIGQHVIMAGHGGASGMFRMVAYDKEIYACADVDGVRMTRTDMAQMIREIRAEGGIAKRVKC